MSKVMVTTRQAGLSPPPISPKFINPESDDPDQESTQQLSKSARKKLEKQRRRAEMKAEKAAAKGLTSESEQTNEAKLSENISDMDPTAYYENRKKQIEELEASGFNPYPHKFETTITLPQFREQYDNIEAGEHCEDVSHALTGRIVFNRGQGGLIFYTIDNDGARIQIMANKKLHNEEACGRDFKQMHSILHRGDFVGFIGYPGKSKKGELSLFVNTCVLLTPCLHAIPKETYGLKDLETRYRQRYLDMIVNKEVIQTFRTRSRIIKYLRRYLDDRAF